MRPKEARVQTEISLIDLVNALEATTHGLEWRVDLVTGDFLPADGDDAASRVSAANGAGGRFRVLPTNGALREAESRREFCATLRDPSVRKRLADASGSREFAERARSANVLDDWLVHRRSRLVNVALEWADAEDVICRRDLTPASFATS